MGNTFWKPLIISSVWSDVTDHASAILLSLKLINIIKLQAILGAVETQVINANNEKEKHTKHKKHKKTKKHNRNNKKNKNKHKKKEGEEE